MKVLVTGGTGFVGSHSVKAIGEAGHDLRLLVRSPGRLAPALEPLGVRGVEHVVGDATDAEAVGRAMDGCDAVVHAAAVFSYDAREDREMQRVNARATEVVLGAACEAGLDPIVHVSSYVALLPPGGVLSGDSPVGEPRGVYARSKAETERMARQLQDQGAPVVITYPGMVWGPHDPHLGESATLARSVLRGLVPLVPPGGLPIVDVREVAAAHAALLTPGRGPGRYMLAGGTASLAELIDLIRRVTGRRLVRATVPAPLVLGMTAAGDVVQRRAPVPAAVQLRRRVGRHARRSDRRIGHRARPRRALPTAGGLDRGHAPLAASDRPADRPAGRTRRDAHPVTDGGCPIARRRQAARRCGRYRSPARRQPCPPLDPPRWFDPALRRRDPQGTRIRRRRPRADRSWLRAGRSPSCPDHSSLSEDVIV